MIITPRALDYMRDAIALIDAGKIEPTLDCPECDETIDANDDAHLVYRPNWGAGPALPPGPATLLICCEGYHMHRDAIAAFPPRMR